MPDSPYKHMDPYSDPIPEFVQTKERMKFKGEAPGVSGYLQQMLYGGGPPWWQRGFNQMVDMFVPENPMEVVPFGGTTKKGKSTYDYLADQFKPDEKLKKNLLKGAPETSQKHEDPLKMMKNKLMSDDWGYKHAEFPQSKPTLKKSYDEPGEMKSLYDKPEWKPPVKEAAGEFSEGTYDLAREMLSHRLDPGRPLNRKANIKILDRKGNTQILQKDWPEVRYLDMETKGNWRKKHMDSQGWLEMISDAAKEAYPNGSTVPVLPENGVLTDNAYRFIGFRESDFLSIPAMLKKRGPQSRKDMFDELQNALSGDLDEEIIRQLELSLGKIPKDEIREHSLHRWTGLALKKKLNAAHWKYLGKSPDWWDENISPDDFDDEFFNIYGE